MQVNCSPGLPTFPLTCTRNNLKKQEIAIKKIIVSYSKVTWCGQVFVEPGTVLCTLISQTLAHLDPSLSSCITEFIKNESNIIAKLIELRQVGVNIYNMQLKAFNIETEYKKLARFSVDISTHFGNYQLAASLKLHFFFQMFLTGHFTIWSWLRKGSLTTARCSRVIKAHGDIAFLFCSL